MDHRWGTRIDLDVPAEIRCHDGRIGVATVRNASVSGAFIESSLECPVLCRVTVRPLSRPGTDLEAYVVRTDQSGFGVEWLQPGARPVSRMLPLRDTGTLRPHADHLHRQHHATFVELAEDFALAQS